MKFLLNFALKWSGAGKVWAMIDGYKMYGTCTLGVLGALLGLATQVAPILSAHDTIALYNFVTSVSSNPNWLALLAFLAGIAKAHRDDKKAAALKVAAGQVDSTVIVVQPEINLDPPPAQ